MKNVDLINLWLLIGAFFVAYLVPFELLLLSYAFLGPLHYLTEISWLHDRKYFTILPNDPYWLVGGSIVLMGGVAFLLPQAAEMVWGLLLLAFCVTYIKSWKKRLVVMGAGALLLLTLLGSTTSYLLAVLVPTVVHVYLFTILFMLFGALKSNSSLGLINSALFFFGGVLLLLLPQSNILILPEYVNAHYTFFGGIAEAFADTFSLSGAVVLSAIASFLAFAYTYHYLNWFSKTSIIEWHAITWQRSFVIGVLYAISVGLYLHDYALGFVALITLSFLHVIFEFPLNFKSIEGVYKEVRKRTNR